MLVFKDLDAFPLRLGDDGECRAGVEQFGYRGGRVDNDRVTSGVDRRVAVRYFGTANRGPHFRAIVRHRAKSAEGCPMDSHRLIATNNQDNRNVLEDVLREVMK